MKRLLIFFIAIVTLFSFAACKDNTPSSNAGNNNEVVNGNNNEAGEPEGLSNERYDGYNFRLLVRKDTLNGYYLEEDSTDPVESAVYKRNKLVEEKYGITISATESSAGYETDALNTILAGDDAYDLIFCHARSAFTYAVQGAAYNVNEISTIHLDKPWWYKDLVESFTLNDKLYILDGDIGTSALGSVMCLFFNKRIFDELGFEYPYDLVLDGDWTFDEFAYISKKGGRDLDGDGLRIYENDQFGFVAPEWTAPINILYTGGQKIYDKNEEGKMELTLYTNKTVNIFDSFFNLMDTEACFVQFQGGDEMYTGTPLFESGRAMIYADTLGAAKYFRTMDDDFGIIPYPKFDETDEYATAVNGATDLMIIPLTVADPERNGAIIEALCAYGSRDIIPVFYDLALKTKYARDNESEKMMDIIRDSIVYDVGYLAGGSFQSVGRDISRLENHDFTSFYQARENLALETVKEFNEDYGGYEE